MANERIKGVWWTYGSKPEGDWYSSFERAEAALAAYVAWARTAAPGHVLTVVIELHDGQLAQVATWMGSEMLIERALLRGGMRGYVECFGQFTAIE